MREFDLIVIGSGPGGYISALYASDLGMRTCVIERSDLGGACLNRGCIPTKVMLDMVRTVRKARAARTRGLSPITAPIDYRMLTQQRDEIVTRQRNGIAGLFKARAVTLMNGTGTMRGASAVEVNGETLQAKNIIIATGSRPTPVAQIPFDERLIVSSDGALAFTDCPKSILVVGGGAIGCEFAHIFNTFGAKVYIVEVMDQILPGIDREIAKKLEMIFTKDGITVHTAKKAERVEQKPGGVAVTLSDTTVVNVERVLVAVGRSPNTSGIGLEESGIHVERSRVVVDKALRTNVNGVWAIGDIIDGPMLAHAASYEGIIACDNMSGKDRTLDVAHIPNCVYTEPGIATVGLSEKSAREKYGDRVKVAKFPFRASSKAVICGQIEGFIKLIADTDEKVLGVQIFGTDAAELIAEACLAVKVGARVSDIQHTVHAHPTLSEVYHDAAYLWAGTPISSQ